MMRGYSDQKGSVNEIFTLKQLNEKGKEKDEERVHKIYRVWQG